MAVPSTGNWRSPVQELQAAASSSERDNPSHEPSVLPRAAGLGT